MSRTVVIFIVLSLLGLIVIQAGMLHIGQSKEKEEYVSEVNAVMLNVSTYLFEDTALSQLIADLSIAKEKNLPQEDTLAQKAIEQIDTIFKKQLAARGIAVDYAFVLTDSHNEPILSSKNFNAEQFKFNRYARPLGLVNELCDCEVTLQFYQKNLYAYLFRQLAYLLIPSLLFLLIIVAGFSFLVYTVNKQKRLLVIKNDFINNLTHELKTPVFSISLLTKVFKEGLKNNRMEKFSNYLNLLEKENTKLKGHIDKVLELASLENGKYNLQKEPCDFHDIINDAITGFALKIETQQGKLSKTFQAVSTQIAVDKTHFKNVLHNLIDNAIKYSKGRPEINITTRSDRQHLSIAVSDKGMGIAPEHQKHLFDKFYRVTTGNIHQVKGFGLGLSYVKYIVEAHGGSISVNSKKNEGSTFLMEFPL
ncbi:MAG: HAMP domain-containing sensor histidine kinase [Bacteroidota bacterium]